MKFLILSSDPTILKWNTLPKKKAAIKAALDLTPNETWEVEVQYRDFKPVLNSDNRIDHGWYNSVSYPLWREGWHYVYLHFSVAQWHALGLDKGIRGANQIDTDVVGESYGWADENTRRGNTGYNQFIQNILHEQAHQLARDTSTIPDPTHEYHDLYKNITGIFAQFDMKKWHPRYVTLLKQKKNAAEKLLSLLQPKYQRPLPYHWDQVTQPWGNMDTRLYPRSGVHPGTDFAAPDGTPILAPADGTITRSGYTESMGYWVEFKMGNRYLVALHLSTPQEKRAVKVGHTIGYVGRTGSIFGVHAHLEWWKIPMDRALLTSASAVAEFTEDILDVIQ